MKENEAIKTRHINYSSRLMGPPSFKEARQEGGEAGLFKSTSLTEDIIRKLLIPEEAIPFVLYLDGRERSHIYRLLSREGAEREFGKAYAMQIQEVKSKHPVGQIATYDMLGGEGVNTTLFWTHAPYLYQVLMERGVSPFEAVRKIILWGNIDCAYGEMKVFLQGLEDLNQNNDAN